MSGELLKGAEHSAGTLVKIPGLVERVHIGTRSIDFIVHRKATTIKLSDVDITVYPAIYRGVMIDVQQGFENKQNYTLYPQWYPKKASAAINLGLAVSSSLVEERGRLMYDDETKDAISLKDKRRNQLQGLIKVYALDTADIVECEALWRSFLPTFLYHYPEVSWAASLSEVHSRKKSGLKSQDEGKIIQ